LISIAGESKWQQLFTLGNGAKQNLGNFLKPGARSRHEFFVSNKQQNQCQFTVVYNRQWLWIGQYVGHQKYNDPHPKHFSGLQFIKLCTG